MVLTEKIKIRIVYISAAVLIFAAIAGAVIYDMIFAARQSSTADAVSFQLALHQVQAAVDSAQQRTILELEQKKWDGFTLQLSTRLDARQQELLVLVNPWNTVPEDYKVRLAETENGFLVDSRCADALARMLYDCRSAGCSPEICSTYRTKDYQQMLYDNKVTRVMATGMYSYEDALIEAATAVAIPDTSEHQLGLAVDILDQWYTNMDYWQQYTYTQQWLMENCYDYGFILRYPNGSGDVTGIIFEPWHYRYVGVETAKAIRASGLTMEEYLESLGQ